MKPIYEFRDGMRLVKPYIYTFSTHAKGRWMDRALLDILTSEFRAHPAQYWEAAIRRGFVTINGNQILDKNMHYIMKNGDVFAHKVHRHEPTIYGDIAFVGQTDELFAVNKPATMPMHPSGSYKFNSLMSILCHEPVVENQPEKLHLIHRLDRVTSGVVVMAKNAQIATKLCEDIKIGKTQKTYLARIKGKFPSPTDLHSYGMREMSTADLTTELERVRHEMYEAGHVGPNSSGARDNRKRKQGDAASAEERSRGKPAIDDRVVMPFVEVFKSEKVGFGVLPDKYPDAIIVSCPLRVLNPREGIHTCDPSGKESFSAFRCLGFDEASNTSLVECQPLTGRTHQLRLHLQLIGHSIANDPCYGGELFYGDNEKKERAVRALRRMKAMNVEPLSKVPHLQGIAEKEEEDSLVKEEEKEKDEELSADDLYALEREEGESDESFLQRVCRFCHAGCASWDRIEDEAALHCDGIYLHALSYASTHKESAGAWRFETEYPEWANVFSRNRFL